MTKRSVIVLSACTLLGAALGACQSTQTAAKGEDQSMCMAPKPGTITSVNQYCVMVNADPVNPEVVTQWKGQTVGFCCNGCVPKWEKLTEAQKDAALAKAVAKGKIKA